MNNKDLEKIVKCERCGRVRKLFQYTHFEEDNFVKKVKDNGDGHNPRFTEEIINLAQCRGLCEECGVEINKKNYDSRKKYE